MHYILTMQGVVRHYAIDRFLNTKAVLIVLKAGSRTGLAHALELAALLPSISPGGIGQRVANGTEKAIRQLSDGQLSNK